MKQSIYYLAAVLIVLTLAACGNKKEKEPTIKEPPPCGQCDMPELPPALNEPVTIEFDGDTPCEEMQEAITGKWKWYWGGYADRLTFQPEDYEPYPDYPINYCTFLNDRIVIEDKNGCCKSMDSFYWGVGVICDPDPCPPQYIMYVNYCIGTHEYETVSCRPFEIREDTLLIRVSFAHTSLPRSRYEMHKLIKQH